MVKKYSNLYEKFAVENVQTKKIIYKKRNLIKANKLPIKRIIALTACIILLFFILPYSFNSYIKDILPDRKSKYFNINYEKLMYPAQLMLPYQNLVFGKYELKNIKYDNPLMVNIPESFERIGLKNSLLKLSEEYKKIHPSIYVWEYKGKSYVDINADEIFPAASIIKVPILIEMFRNIEQNKYSLYDTMVLEDYFRADGSGKLKNSQSGISHTLDHLARIMIENSDNSSTNMILSKIGGMPEVNLAIKKWGLKTTSINNWLPDLEGTNITTARELAKMFYNIDLTGILSNKSKQHIASYMSNVKNTRLLKSGLPDDAVILHKTGDIGFMLGDAGIVRASNGKKYIVVILVKRPYNNFQGKDFIVKASNLIYKHIAL